MTDRIKGLIITFDRDIRDDDAEPIIAAIQLIVGVADAKALVEMEVASFDDYFARARVRESIGRLLHEKINEVCDPELHASMRKAKESR